MIVVKIEMWPGGDKTKAYPLGCINITNDGSGTAELGNYNGAASHAGKFWGRKGVFKAGRVVGFPRRFSPYRLLYRMLRAMGEL